MVIDALRFSISHFSFLIEHFRIIEPELNARVMAHSPLSKMFNEK
jgi:hypothetical protein